MSMPVTSVNVWRGMSMKKVASIVESNVRRDTCSTIPRIHVTLLSVLMGTTSAMSLRIVRRNKLYARLGSSTTPEPTNASVVPQATTTTSLQMSVWLNSTVYVLKITPTTL